MELITIREARLTVKERRFLEATHKVSANAVLCPEPLTVFEIPPETLVRIERKYSGMRVQNYFNLPTCIMRGLDKRSRGNIIGACERFPRSGLAGKQGLPFTIASPYDLFLVGRKRFAVIVGCGPKTAELVGLMFRPDGIPW